MDPTTLEIHTRRLKAYKDENGSSADGGEVQTDLFGNDDSAMLEMVKISKAAGELVKENKQKILAVKGVVKRPQVAKEMGVDINDPEAVKAAIAQLEYENQRLMSPTPEPEILHKIKVRAGLETEESQVVETDEAAAMQDDSLDLGLAASGGMSPRSLKIREKLKGIFDKIFSEKIPNVMFDFAKVSKRTIDKVLEITSGKVDLSEYKHVISSNSIYHARKGGHFEGNNFSDSLPLTKEDLLRVGDVVENWDDITFRKRKNADTITYQKAYPDGTILYVEEILNGDGNRRPKRLASKTIYKRKSGRFTNTAEASRYTSKTMSQSHSSNPQSDNSAQSQGKKSGNVKGGIEAKQVDASADISEPIDVAEADYRKISEIAQKEFKAKPALLSRVISKSRSILPRTVKFDKSKNRLAGVPSIADIRRYAERAFALPIAAKMRRDNPKFLGVYLSDLQAIRTRGGHTNDIGLLAHELGHHLETILFAGKLSEAETAAARELAAYCVERFGDNAYPQNEHVSEGFAQFISDVITDVNDARARCPQAYALLERALRDNSNAAAVFDNIRQMVALNKNGSTFDRVQANIRRKSDMEKTPFMEKIKGLRRLYRRKLIDSNEGIAELAQEVDRQSPGNGKKFLDMVTNYQGGHIGQSDYSIKNQQLDIDGNVVGKGLEQIMSDNLGAAFDRESFSAYLYARRAGKSDKNFFSKMLDNFFYRIKHRRIIKKQMNNWWFSRKVA